MKTVQILKVNHKKHKISFRKASAKDKAFLLQLYNSTREDVWMYAYQMTEQEKIDFIRTQFEFQDKHYRKYYPDAEYLVIQSSKKDVGRLYMEEWPSQIRIMDITIDPNQRGKGIGGMVMDHIINEAADKNKGVSIHVMKDNRAMHLYERLGFEIDGGTEVYHLMKKDPPTKKETERSSLIKEETNI